jgi:hypothetical protein
MSRSRTRPSVLRLDRHASTLRGADRKFDSARTRLGGPFDRAQDKPGVGVYEFLVFIRYELAFAHAHYMYIIINFI